MALEFIFNLLQAALARSQQLHALHPARPWRATSSVDTEGPSGSPCLVGHEGPWSAAFWLSIGLVSLPSRHLSGLMCIPCRFGRETHITWFHSLSPTVPS